MRDYIKQKTTEELGREPESITTYEEGVNTIYRVEIGDDTGFEIIVNDETDREVERETIDYKIEVLTRVHEEAN